LVQTFNISELPPESKRRPKRAAVRSELAGERIAKIIREASRQGEGSEEAGIKIVTCVTCVDSSILLSGRR